MQTAPAFETARLTFRGHGLADFADSAALWADPEVTRHIGKGPSTEEESWTRFLRYVGHWALLGFGYWVLHERESGRFVGEVGFADYHRALSSPLDGMPEIGWVLATWAHGRGLATEAVRAVVAWGDARFGDSARTACIIRPDNLASLRVAAKCGYQRVAEATYNGRSTLLYVRGDRSLEHGEIRR
jgi:RimJ/RimL family protein N-acetyltransferase